MLTLIAPAMSRVYGLKPWDLRRLTVPELDAYRTDLIGLTKE